MNQLVVDFSFDPKELRLVLDTLRELMTDANLMFDRNGMQITGVDPNRLVAVNLQMHAKDGIVMQEHEEIFFGVYIPFLYKVLRYASTGDVATFRIYENELDVMILNITNLSSGAQMLTSFRNVMIPVDRYESTTNNNQFCKLRFPSVVFGKQLKEISSVSKNITLKFENQTFVLSGNNETSSVKRINNNMQYFDAPLSFCYEKTFVLRYLEKFIKPNLSASVLLKFDPSGIEPLEMSHTFESGMMRMKIMPVTLNFDGMENQDLRQ